LDRDGAEIAAALHIKPGYVRVLRHRALDKLRRALEETEEEAS
jgi:DNA-directed RNA polymerase specialized sigma24 family protein